ncbi:MAG: ATP-binding cassette domain-containing protein [Candidatus Babeliales bacterium]
MALLSVHNLSTTIGKRAIVRNVSLSVASGQVVALLGPNGAGKTTLLKTIMGLYATPVQREQNANQITFDGQTINNVPVHQRVTLGLVYLPQQPSLFQQLTVKDNLELVFQYHDYWRNRGYELFLQERDYWLKHTDLVATLTLQGAALSGGQKRKLEVVRSMLMHPRAILLDEPFAGVDPKSIYELKALFQQMASQGMAVVISDHNVDQLLSIAQYAYVVVQGQVVVCGTIQEILENRYTQESYLGNQFYQEMFGKFCNQSSPSRKDDR